MASEQDDAVFDHSLDDDDDDEYQSQDDDDLIPNDNDDVLIEEDDEEEEEEELNSPSTSSPIPTPTTITTTTTSVKPAVTVAVPIATPSISAVTIAAVPNGNEPGIPDPKRPRIGEFLTVQQQEEKKPAPILDESRRLFQRLWTDEDEIELLQGFLDYTATRGSAHHHDTALFYDQIKSKLQLDFNKNQLVEKLRRLKKKYRNVVSKINSGKDFSFKSAHDHATFEISQKIWSNSNNNNNGGAVKGGSVVDDTVLDDDEVNLNPSFSNVEVKSEDFVIEKKTTTTAPRSRKRSRPSKSGVKIDEIVANNANIENNNSGGGGVGVVEETVRSCLTPLFKELLSGAMMMGGGGGVCGGGRGIGGLAMNAMPLSFGMPAMMMSSFGGSGEVVDERWRKQQILELEVYSKRLELVQDQIKVALEDLRSMGG